MHFVLHLCYHRHNDTLYSLTHELVSGVCGNWCRYCKSDHITLLLMFISRVLQVLALLLSGTWINLFFFNKGFLYTLNSCCHLLWWVEVCMPNGDWTPKLAIYCPIVPISVELIFEQSSKIIITGAIIKSRFWKTSFLCDPFKSLHFIVNANACWNGIIIMIMMYMIM